MSVTCAICQEDINFCAEEISVLNCGHLYHNRCLQQWLSTNSTCPECRSAVTRNNFVRKLYPSKKEDAESVYRGTSEETKSILKVFEESTKNLQRMFTERILNLENKNLELEEMLKKSSEKLQKSINEKENLRSKLDNEELKNKVLKSQIKKLEEKLSPVNSLDKINKCPS